MGAAVTLPILIPDIPGQHWSCHSCGDCCRTLVVHLTRADRERIDALEWLKELDKTPYVRVGRSWALNKRPDGACVFLSEDNRCTIHARSGEDAKPFACRVFPFSLRHTAQGWQASLRFDCPSVRRSQGEPVARQQAQLARIVGTLDHSVGHADPPGRLQGRGSAAQTELDALDHQMLRWLRDPDRSMRARLFGAVRLTTTLHSAKLKKVRGDRFVELLDLLFGALDTEALPPIVPPTDRQCGLMRQSAFAHAEHLSLSEARRGLASNAVRRMRQLKHSRAFINGKGTVPEMSGVKGGTRFERVDRIAPADRDGVKIDDLLVRYLTARIEGRAVYGGGYYGWSALDGYPALWMSLAVTGWLARCFAAIAEREALAFDDVADALAIVDRAASRLPALGTFVERARLAYLMREDGIARLLHRYAFTRREENA